DPRGAETGLFADPAGDGGHLSGTGEGAAGGPVSGDLAAKEGFLPKGRGEFSRGGAGAYGLCSERWRASGGAGKRARRLGATAGPVGVRGSRGRPRISDPPAGRTASRCRRGVSAGAPGPAG